MKYIPLSKGQFVIVNDEDFDLLSKYKWHVLKSKRSHSYIANTSIYKVGNLKMHRLILGLTDPKIKVDHKDRNGLNSTRENLRIATNQQNNRNKSEKRNRKQKYIGARGFKHSKKFAPYIVIDGK